MINAPGFYFWQYTNKKIHTLIFEASAYEEPWSRQHKVAVLRRWAKPRRMIITILPDFTPSNLVEVMVVNGMVTWSRARKLTLVTLRLYGHSLTMR